MDALGTSYTIEQVAKSLAVSTFTIRRAIKAGRIKAVKAGVSWRIPEEEALRVVSEGFEPATARDKASA